MLHQQMKEAQDMKKKDELPNCPVATTVSLIGSKWKLLIIRTVFPEVPPRVEYALSELGESLRPLIEDMAAWGNAYKSMAGPADHS